MDKEIVILGAGIVGLSTANRLIEILEQKLTTNSYKIIAIISEKFQKDTTSDGAGGILRAGKKLKNQNFN
jgi:glycine/D-amino acid oxidase-like deaminating enzyme